MDHAFSNRAKPALERPSWHPARFLLPLLLCRTICTTQSVAQQENALGTQVHSLLGQPKNGVFMGFLNQAFMLLAQAQSKFKPQNCGGGQSDAYKPGNKPQCLTNLPRVEANDGSLQQAMGIVFGVAAAIALISLVIAALNYATAATDTEKIARSRKAIIYSLLGLVIAITAEAMVLTLLDNL